MLLAISRAAGAAEAQIYGSRAPPSHRALPTSPGRDRSCSLLWGSCAGFGVLGSAVGSAGRGIIGGLAEGLPLLPAAAQLSAPSAALCCRLQATWQSLCQCPAGFGLTEHGHGVRTWGPLQPGAPVSGRVAREVVPAPGCRGRGAPPGVPARSPQFPAGAAPAWRFTGRLSAFSLKDILVINGP